jgi:hypothetical protein
MARRRLTTRAKIGAALGQKARKCVPMRHGTFLVLRRYFADSGEATQEKVMGRGLLLWLIGIPLPIILVIWVLGGLHG